MPKPLYFALIALVLFTALLGLEQVGSTQKFDLVAFVADLFEMALLAGAVAMTAFFLEDLLAPGSERDPLRSALPVVASGQG